MNNTKIVLAFERIRSSASPRDFLLLTFAAVLQAVNFNLFLAPTDVAPGGVSGLALIINSFLGTPLGMTQFLRSIPRIILGFSQLGRANFLIRTLWVSLIYAFGVDFLAQWMPAQGITPDLVLNALFGGVIGGIASGLAFRGRGTFAGTGIISRIIQLRTSLPITQLYMIIDGGIILALGAVFGWENALYALVMLFVWGLATDYALEGPSVIRTVHIITDYPNAVSNMLITRMGIGVTSWTGQGMYTQAEHSVLYCTISRADVETIKNLVMEADEDAFVAIGQGHSASGGVWRAHKLRKDKRAKPVPTKDSED